MLKCIDRLYYLARCMGAAVDYDYGACDIYVDAKPGYVWHENGFSLLTEACGNSAGQRWVAKACKPLEKNMQRGMVRADEQEIANIEYIRAEPWRAEPGEPDHILPPENFEELFKKHRE